MTWFLQCSGIYHYVLVIITAIYVASGIFIIIVLSPFQGYLAITAEPYSNALIAMEMIMNAQ